MDDTATPALTEPEDKTKALSRSMTRATTWSLVAYVVSQVLRLASNMILWRLLAPEIFGLMALVWSVTMGLAMFSDVGTGPSIIQRKEGNDERFINTAWTIGVMRGIALFVVTAAISYPVAMFYDEPQLGPVLAAVSIGSMIAGFNSTRLFSEAREISLGRITLIDLSVQVITLIATVAYAYVSPTIWSVVVGGLIGTVLKTALSHAVLPGIKNRLVLDRKHLKELVTFGRWVFVSTLLTFAAMQSDRLIFGKLISIESLGIYNIANLWAAIPQSVLGGIFNSVLFPALCKINNDDADFGKVYRSMRAPWLILGSWLCCALVVGGPALIRALYDERAADAEWVVQILACSTWLYTLENANGTALLAKGMPKFVAVGNTSKVIGMVLLIPIGFQHYGFAGAVAGYTLAEGFRYVTSVYLLQRLGIKTVLGDIWLLLVSVASMAFAWVIRDALRAPFASLLGGIPRGPWFAEALVVGLTTGAVWGATFLWHRRSVRALPAEVGAS